MRMFVRIYLTYLFVLFAPTVHAQPVPCDKTDGKGIVGCVAATYPDRLAAGVSKAERERHMAFLRDRIIETARCAMLDVGLNLKRGGPTISLDFIVWNTGGRTVGVDIGSSWDDTAQRLKLTWHTYGPPNYGYPTFQAYGPVSCVIQPPPEPPAPPFDPAPLLSEMTRLSEAVNSLRTDNAALRTQLAALRTQFANLEHTLPTIESRVFTLEQRPYHDSHTCRGRIVFGMIPVSCRVTAEVNP